MKRKSSVRRKGSMKMLKQEKLMSLAYSNRASERWKMMKVSTS